MSGTDKIDTASLLSLEDVISAADGIHLLGNGEFCFTSVQTDSRSVVQASLFVPLIGEKQDGHKYIPQAVEKGASVVLICLKNYEADSSFFTEISLKAPNVYFIGVQNTLTALQKIAGRYVEKFPDLIKIGVTGSSGKTTTKEIAASILRQKYNVITNEGNLNSETGLPLSVFKIRSEHTAGIFEMGMNRKDEIAEIAAVLKPRFAIVTNIGTAHIGMLGSRQNIAEEKSKVFSHFNGFGTAFIPKNDDFAEYLASQVDGNVVFYGPDAVQEEDDPCKVAFVRDLGLGGTELSIGGKKAVLALPGKYNYNDALGAIALAKLLGLGAQQIADGINEVKSVFGRTQVLRGNGDFSGLTVVQDCYNANPDSMEKAVEFISSIKNADGGNQEEPKVLVLGDMKELGEDSEAEHEKTGAQAAKSGCSLVIFIGNEMTAAYSKALDLAKEKNLKVKIEYFAGNEKGGADSGVMEKAGKDVLEFARANGGRAVVLVKGSRGMELERVTSVLTGNGGV